MMKLQTLRRLLRPTLTAQSSCDDTSPNGAITASVTPGGVDADFDFQVFRGQNTTPANEVTGLTATTFVRLSSGIYTVLATHTATGCFSSTEVTIENTPTNPVVTAVAGPAQTVCTPGIEDGQGFCQCCHCHCRVYFLLV